MTTPRLLVVDDDREVAEFLALVGQEGGFDVRLASGDFAGLPDQYREFAPDVIITDLQMPGMDGVELMRGLAEHECRAGIVVLSGLDTRVIGTARRLGDALGLKILGALQKPVSVPELGALLQGGVKRSPVPGDELLAHYQPKVALAGAEHGRVMGVEALVRWQHPRLGLVGPDAFVPMAEAHALIGELTETVFRRVAADARVFKARGLDLPVAVNLSPLVLDDLRLPDHLLADVQAAGLTAGDFVLEITETGAVDVAPRVMDILTRFRLKGFELPIDDFGTGSSSLVKPFRMPFTELKVDKSFVMETGDDEEARVIVRAIVDLAHNLALSVCAEGVETEAHWRFLAALGCDRAQGFHIARPMPPEALPAWVAQWPRRRAGAAAG